ncbi:MAG: hypothetical protein ABI579_09665 [Candidatus Sumerlaeota bacterium]
MSQFTPPGVPSAGVQGYGAPQKKKMPVWVIVLIVILAVSLLCLFILLVLAAIAVPNFLEAQTRSKVSRSKSDMRSLATGIENYLVDNNALPAHTVSYMESADRSAAPKAPTFKVAGLNGSMSLTTPIAYLVLDQLVDPFAANKITGYRYYAVEDGWIVWSAGPDKDYDITPELDYSPSFKPSYNPVPARLSNVSYDPTNGTISDGDIWRVRE